MKIRMPLSLLAAIAAASPAAAAELCTRWRHANTIAETLPARRREPASQCHLPDQGRSVKISENLKSKYSDAMTIILQNEFKQLTVKDYRFEVIMWPATTRSAHRALRCDQGVLGQRNAEVLHRLK